MEAVSDFQPSVPNFEPLIADFESLFSCPVIEKPVVGEITVEPGLGSNEDFESLLLGFKPLFPDFESLLPDFESLLPDFESLLFGFKPLLPDLESGTPELNFFEGFTPFELSEGVLFSLLCLEPSVESVFPPVFDGFFFEELAALPLLLPFEF